MAKTKEGKTMHWPKEKDKMTNNDKRTLQRKQKKNRQYNGQNKRRTNNTMAVAKEKQTIQ